MKKLLCVFLFLISFSANSQVFIEKYKDYFIRKAKLEYKEYVEDTIKFSINSNLGFLNCTSKYLPSKLGNNSFFYIDAFYSTEMYDRYDLSSADGKSYIIYFDKYMTLVFIYNLDDMEYYSVHGNNIEYKVNS
jgi:hypothetical protein